MQKKYIVCKQNAICNCNSKAVYHESDVRAGHDKSLNYW